MDSPADLGAQPSVGLGLGFSSEQRPSIFLAPGPGFVQDSFPMDGVRDGFGMIQTHYTYCALYFYYDYPSSTSGHQALDPGSWGALP